MSAPWNVTAPRVGRGSPLTPLRIVDLPDPFEPMITVMAPCFASSPTPESTWVPAYPASIPSSRSTGRLRAEVRLDDRGVADDLLRRPLRNLQPFLDHHDAVGEREDGPHDVFDDQCTNPEFLLDPREQLDRLAEFPGGQSREHLVQEENSRARRDDSREFQPLPVLHGEVRCEGSGFCLQAYESKNAGRLLGGLLQVCPPQGAEQGRDGHVLATCHPGEWLGDLMGLGDPPPDDAVRWFPVNSTAIEGDRPRARLLHPGDHVQEGRLPRAVRSDEPDDLALGEGERHAPEGPHAPEILVDSLGDECHRHSRIPRRIGTYRRSDPTIPSGITSAMKVTSPPITMNSAPLATVRKYVWGMYTTTAPTRGPNRVPDPPTITIASIRSENRRANAASGNTPDTVHAFTAPTAPANSPLRLKTNSFRRVTSMPRVFAASSSPLIARSPYPIRPWVTQYVIPTSIARVTQTA